MAKIVLDLIVGRVLKQDDVIIYNAKKNAFETISKARMLDEQNEKIKELQEQNEKLNTKINKLDEKLNKLAEIMKGSIEK